MNHPLSPTDIENITTAVQHWVETVIVGLNLCPFAKRELLAQRIRWHVSTAESEEQALVALQAEFEQLKRDPEIETTLLILPNILQDFSAYNQFLNYADLLVEQMELDGVFQIASFHPKYQYAGTESADAENYINRSPYPILHILREDGVAKAVASYPDIEQIPQRNIELMDTLGVEKLEALFQACFKK